MHPMVKRVIRIGLNVFGDVCHLARSRWSISISRGGDKAHERYEKTLRDSKQGSSSLMREMTKTTCITTQMSFF